MEDLTQEVEGVNCALVDIPTLERQKKTLEKYCTKDVEFYHLYINLNTGIKALIAVYKGAELLLNYRFVMESFVMDQTHFYMVYVELNLQYNTMTCEELPHTV